jgi:glyoxylase-like metal-dependent hydrolase (beta-lactamase superfamily II)
MLTVGPVQANCYVIGCEETLKSAVIDPGDETNRILMTLAEDRLTATHIICTHGHFDHVGGNKKLKDATGAAIVIHPLDAPMLGELSGAGAAWGLPVDNSPPPDILVEEGDSVSVGTIELKILHTPGHSPGGISLYYNGVVFVGDTLFAGSIGRTDFQGGSYATLISSIKKKLFALSDEVQVLSGHGPVTTIGWEKQHNPFFR